MNILRKYFFGIFVLMVILFCPVMAITENFQSWGSSVLTGGIPPVGLTNALTGDLSLYMGPTGYPLYNTPIQNINQLLYSYAAYDMTSQDSTHTSCPIFTLEDSGYNTIASYGFPGQIAWPNPERAEMNIIGIDRKSVV